MRWLVDQAGWLPYLDASNFRTFLFPRGTPSSKLDASNPTESGTRPCRVGFARTAMGKLNG